MRATWRIYAAHPWLLDYNMARLPIGPHVLDVEEALYAALYAAGFTGAENVAISNLIRWQLIGAARSMISDAAEERHTGVSAEAYWESRSSFWMTYFDADPLPDHGGGLGGRRLRRPGRLGLRADDHPAAGRHRAVGGRPQLGLLGRGFSWMRAVPLAPTEDAAEEVLVLVLRGKRVDLPVERRSLSSTSIVLTTAALHTFLTCGNAVQLGLAQRHEVQLARSEGLVEVELRRSPPVRQSAGASA